MPIDYDAAARLLETAFSRAEASFLRNQPPPEVSDEIGTALVAVFT